MSTTTLEDELTGQVTIRTAGVELEGDLTLPLGAPGVVLFAHGSGSSRHSRRNRLVAGALNEAGLGTLLMDLLTDEEERVDAVTAHLRFDVGMLARRLIGAVDWLDVEAATRALPVGCFGASTGAAAAIAAAAERPGRVKAVVSRGGRPDLAAEWLDAVQAPVLLIVGGDDPHVLSLNRAAYDRLSLRDKQLTIVPGASHLFEEPGALEEVAQLAAGWFTQRLHR